MTTERVSDELTQSLVNISTIDLPGGIATNERRSDANSSQYFDPSETIKTLGKEFETSDDS